MVIIIHPASIIICILKIIMVASSILGLKVLECHISRQSTIIMKSCHPNPFRSPPLGSTWGRSAKATSPSSCGISVDNQGNLWWWRWWWWWWWWWLLFYHYCCCYCYCLLTFVINIGICRFRSMWERYCRGVNAIVYMVDAADQDKIEVPVSPTP